jgi:beta-lactamase class D
MKAIPAFLIVTVLFTACSTNNVKVDDSFQTYFDSAGVKGCFALFDNGQGRFTIYNLPRYRDSAYQPGETFDIVEALIALQTGAVNDENSPIYDSASFHEDSATFARMSSHRITTTLRQSFQADSGYGMMGFLRISNLIGQDTLKKWVDSSLHYGKHDSGKIIHPSLKITPDQQLGLIKKLYFGQLPFFKRPQEIVRGLMRVESNSNYKLYYKTTSQGITADGKAIGWAVGWIEENRHPYFFVVNLDMDGANRHDTGLIGLEIAKKILRQMGFFGGTK